MKTMKLLWMTMILASPAFSQNIQIIDCPDTVQVNSNAAEHIIHIGFVNDSSASRTIAVMETPILQLSGVTDTVGFFAAASPLPGEPEHILVEPFDTVFAAYYINPNGNSGTHGVQICFFDMNAPSNTVCCEIWSEMTNFANLEKQINNQMTLFPNPTRDKFKIQNTHGFESFKLFDMYGSQIMDGSINENEDIPVDHLPAGIYFVNLMGSGHQIETFKLIKQ